MIENVTGRSAFPKRDFFLVSNQLCGSQGARRNTERVRLS